jgi:hypothetical protein
LTAAHVFETCANCPTEETHFDAQGNEHKKKKRAHKPVKIVQKGRGKEVERWCEIVLYSPPEESGGHDLALLKPRDPAGLKAAKFTGKTPVEAGQTCWYVGTPNGLHRSLEKSVINQTDFEAGYLGGNSYYLANGNGWYGTSGGGIFVMEGEEFLLIGVVVRLVWADARTPVICQTQETITGFLEKLK